MILLGEILAFCASIVWTGSSLSAEVSSKRIGSMPLNLITMFFAFLFLTITLLCFTGVPFPQYLSIKSTLWIIGSGALLYVVCNYFLFSAYSTIGSRLGQLFMTLSAPSAAIMGWILLDERLSIQEIIGIVVTSGGIIISVLSTNSKSTEKSYDKVAVKLTLKAGLYSLLAPLPQFYRYVP